MVLAYSS